MVPRPRNTWWFVCVVMSRFFFQFSLQPCPHQRMVAAYVDQNFVSKFWFDYVEPRAEDDVRTCDLNLWDDGNGGGWKNSGNYSQLQTFFEVCRSGLMQLKKDMAGRHGPVSEPMIWNFMCGVECPLSDMLHLQAMDWTGCRCEDLSTQKDSPYYRVEGDFCLENSARQLCSILGVCGQWNCELADFMCPSHDFRNNYYLGYGFGDCSGAWRRFDGISVLLVSVGVTTLALASFFHA